MPSDRKPSTDQVLTKTLAGFGFFARCVSRSAICTPLTPALCISCAQPSRVFGSSKSRPISEAILTSACFTNHETMPGFAPQQETAVVPPGFRRLAASTVSRSA